ncbi:methyltransferase domain-containing protein [Pseudonocardia sp. DSM 110487]|uniref:SAM-dependent methyltransferase n=1 Tax=Pseudonocardia sp. DSM 110487 TaxID=2865833 RepID=UPI001C69F46B|nr:methyltransferase domain-containing protein [Pseudonocardia sp. DSM 110487]QYN33166.1 methyltransferase domain-containing protein [Pseudonocardia sp. DSM 110487]
MELPRSFLIRESSHRILDPFTSEKLATLGAALRMRPGTRLLDLACGKGELLCTWARDHGVTGVGVDISATFLATARARAVELEVSDRVEFVHADAAGYIAEEPVDIAACLGATWIGQGTAGTLDLLERSLRPGGTALVGERYWRLDPPDQDTVEGCYARNKDELVSLPRLVENFGELGWDLVEMVVADQDSWDRYVAAQWLNIRRWIDANPDDELVGAMRAELATAPLRHVRYQREYVGWGVFALARR